MALYIHARVQYADDFDASGCFAIEDHMATRTQAAIALSEVVAPHAHLRAVDEKSYEFFELAQIPRPLLPAPFALGVATDPLEIRPRRRPDRDLRHLGDGLALVRIKLGNDPLHIERLFRPAPLTLDQGLAQAFTL